MNASVAPGPLVGLLADPRDRPFLGVIATCLTMAACGIGLFFVERWFWPLTIVYWALWGLRALDRFILMLHCTSHRPLFRKDIGWLNAVLIPWVVSPFMGQTPNSYYVHHIGMHHTEDNLQGDLSTTMHYQRDRFTHWLHYLGTFLAFGLPKLAAYHWRRGTKKLFWRLIAGEVAYWSVCAALFVVNPWATFAVFLLPVLVVRSLMMAGNWGQHAFIDPAAPGESWRSSITCINTPYNTRCFNDGFHTMHHKKPRMHWTEYPDLLATEPLRYGEQDALVFDGIDFFQVWALLMLKQHRRLARRVVRLPGAPERSEDEMVALLKERLAPIKPGAAAAPA